MKPSTKSAPSGTPNAHRDPDAHHPRHHILLSGLLVPQGPSSKVLDFWVQGRFTLITCNDLIAEFREVASRPSFRARLRAGVAEQLIVDLTDLSQFVVELPAVNFAADPKDSYLLALAEASGADFLVTGDNALQGLAKHEVTQIVSPATMVRILEDENQEG